MLDITDDVDSDDEFELDEQELPNDDKLYDDDDDGEAKRLYKYMDVLSGELVMRDYLKSGIKLKEDAICWLKTDYVVAAV